MPTPIKDPSQRRRRNASVGKLQLPQGGWRGRAPKWPLDGDQPSMWRELWRTPQAAAWNELGLTRVVARYAMLLTDAERPAATAYVLAEVRQLEDRLGLNPKAMRALLWEISTDELAEKRLEQSVKTPAESARARLKVV